MLRFLSIAIIGILSFLIFSLISPSGGHLLLIHTSDKTHRLMVELALTTDEQAKGFMGREYLAEDQGMLFVYQKEANLAFWMKNMLMPIDIIFIGRDKKIKTIHEKVPPCKEDPCKKYFPSELVQYTLEVQSGFSEANHLAPGDRVEFSLE